MPVPKASESGTSRRGFFTSPAVKVMLFQASAEKMRANLRDSEGNEQTSEARRRRECGNHAAQEVGAGLNGQRALHGPEVREIRLDRCGVAPEEDRPQRSAPGAPVSLRT